VHASEGKRARAEPIALIYEQGRIFHSASLAQPEEELMALGADEAAQNTDRADAARLEPRIRQL
jgi:phage terminase large subunit-like protein